MAIRVIFLTKYGRRAASARLRYLQYIPLLKEAGIECETAPLLDDAYIEKTFAHGRVSPVYLLDRYWQRLKAVLSSRQFDVAVLQYEAFPYFPAWLENALGMRVPYILDIDDAIFHGYDSHRRFLVRSTLRNKIRSVAQEAAFVLAGSPYLVEYARAVNRRVDWAPTCVDVDRFPVKQWDEKSKTPFTIGWIGAPSTVRYAATALPAIRELAARMPVRLMYVGSGPVEYENLIPEVREWSEATEIADMLEFDVGIMPLPDDPWTRGKCAFKLIQYMACGLPVVASPVGMNRNVVTHGQNGFLASTSEEWFRFLEAIARNIALRRKMGKEGRNIAERDYSSEVGGRKLVHAIECVAGVTKEALSGTRVAPL